MDNIWSHETEKNNKNTALCLFAFHYFHVWVVNSKMSLTSGVLSFHDRRSTLHITQLLIQWGCGSESFYLTGFSITSHFMKNSREWNIEDGRRGWQLERHFYLPAAPRTNIGNREEQQIRFGWIWCPMIERWRSLSFLNAASLKTLPPPC